MVVSTQKYVGLKCSCVLCVCVREVDNAVISRSVCVVRAVRNCDLRLVTNETPNKWRPAFLKNLLRAVIELCF